MIISSQVVQCETDHKESIQSFLETLSGVEIITSTESGIAIVLETESTDQGVSITDKIEQRPGVKQIELITHFFEEESLTN